MSRVLLTVPNWLPDASTERQILRSLKSEFAVANALLNLGQVFYQGLPDLNEDDRISTVILTVFLRDAILTSTAAIRLLSQGMYEPAMRQIRSILDIRMQMNYIFERDGDTEMRALLFYAAALERRRTQFTRQRNALPEGDPHQGPLTERLDELDRKLAESETIREARDAVADLKRRRLKWHGFPGHLELAAHLGMNDEYNELYGPLSDVFVHSADPDWHLQHIDGRLYPRSLICRNADQLRTAIGVLWGQLRGSLEMAQQIVSLPDDMKEALWRAKVVFTYHFGSVPATTIRRLEVKFGLPARQWDRLIEFRFMKGGTEETGRQRLGRTPKRSKPARSGRRRLRKTAKRKRSR